MLGLVEVGVDRVPGELRVAVAGMMVFHRGRLEEAKGQLKVANVAGIRQPLVGIATSLTRCKEWVRLERIFDAKKLKERTMSRV